MSSLKHLVQRKLAEAERNPFEAARIGGLERSFVNDILINKKRAVSGENIEKLARAIGAVSSEIIDAMGKRVSPGAYESLNHGGVGSAGPAGSGDPSAEEMFLRLPPDDRKFALEFLEFLAQRSEGRKSSRPGKRGRAAPTKP